MMNGLSLLDSLFDGLNDGYCGNYRAGFVPNVDVKENKNSYTLEMDLPGRTENDVDIRLERNTLTISSKKEEKDAEKTEETKSEKSGTAENSEKVEEPKWLLRERVVSEFSRSFALPEDADSENISALFKNGVLTVCIPRKKAETPKRIAIKAA